MVTVTVTAGAATSAGPAILLVVLNKPSDNVSWLITAGRQVAARL